MADAATAAIEVQGLVKSFGEVVALDGLDLLVEPGTVFGLLGQRGGQDDASAGPGNAAAPHVGAGSRAGLRRGLRAAGGA